MSNLASEIWGALAFGLLSFFTLSIASKKNFFFLPDQKEEWRFSIRWYHILLAFALYFAATVFATPVLAAFLRQWAFPGLSPAELVPFMSWLSLLNSFLILLLLAFYFFQLPRSIASSLWRSPKEAAAYAQDIRMALLCWLVSFPLVLFTNQILDLLIYFVFHVKEIPDQLAVYFLKMTFGHPLYFSFAILTVVLLAPLIEETLFRGFLQSFIRQHLGSRQAIFITAVCFSFFHYSPEQKLANVSIVGSLFILALFLGFLYEKRRSLLAPIALHASFNAISVLNLYFLGGFPKGPL